MPVVEGGCYPHEGCLAYCSEVVPAWPESVADAFAKCVAENPLCFQTIEDCIFQEVNPAGTVHLISIEGQGFSDFDGKTVRIWHDPGAGTPFDATAAIGMGAFAFAFEEPVSAGPQGGPLMLLYIDVDGDGACEAGADVTAAVNPEWNGDFVAPSFAAHLQPPLQDPDFVCDFEP